MPSAVQARELVRANQLTQIDHGVLVAGMTLQLFDLLHKRQVGGEEFLAAYLAVAKFGHERAALMMARFIEAYRVAQTPGQVHAAVLLAEWDADAAYGRSVAALAEARAIEARQGLSQYEVDQQFKRIAEHFSVTEHRRALNAGRDTMVFSTAANGTRWRRVTDGNPCAFCAMLATRSDYRTRESALYVVGRADGYGTAEYKATGRLHYGGRTTRDGKRSKKGSLRTRGSRNIGERYHDRCGCTVAEVVGPWEPNDAERGHAELYGRALDACKEEGLPRTTGTLLAKMRELGDGVVHDAHKPPETDFSTLGPSLWRWLEHLTEIELD